MMMSVLFLLFLFAPADSRLENAATEAAMHGGVRVKAEEKNAAYQQKQLLEKYQTYIRAIQDLGQAMDDFASKYNGAQGQSWPLANARVIARRMQAVDKAYESLVRCEAWLSKPNKE